MGAGLLMVWLVCVGVSTATGSTDYRIEMLQVAGRSAGPGGQTNITCNVSPSNTLLYWQKNGTNVTEDTRTKLKLSNHADYSELMLEISNTRPNDSGVYTCQSVHSANPEITRNESYHLEVKLPGRVVMKEDGRAREGADATLQCEMQGFPLANVEWTIGKSGLKDLIPSNVQTKPINDSYVVTTLQFRQVRHFENGTYFCRAEGPQGSFNGTAHLYVLNKPDVKIDTVKAVGANAVYVNWTAFDGNERISNFSLRMMKENDAEKSWQHVPYKIGGSNTSVLVKNLEPKTGYKFSLQAKNAVGASNWTEYNETVSTLETDPEFVPIVQVRGTTSDSISIGWTSPRPDVKDFVQYYQIVLYDNNNPAAAMETIQPVSSMDDYMFGGLNATTTYTIKIRACSDYTKNCGNWSNHVNGTTLEGTPEAPTNFVLECRYDNISKSGYLRASWQRPVEAYGQIEQYQVTMTGEALYKDQQGKLVNETFGPHIQSTVHLQTTIRNLYPNTNYTVKVAVMTKQRHRGKFAERHCRIPATVPDLTRIDWTRVEHEGRWLLRLNLPRLSERNGAIQCYIVYLVKLLPGQRKPRHAPEEMPVDTYETVKMRGGAYIADAVEGRRWTPNVFLGDGQLMAADSSCLELARRTLPTPTPAPTPSTTPPHPAVIPGLPVPIEFEPEWDASSTEYYEFASPASQPLIGNSLEDQPDRDARSAEEPVSLYDGELDSSANYTGFVQVLVVSDDDTLIPAWTDYLQSVTPGPVPLGDSALSGVQQELTIALHVLIVLVVIVCVLLIILFILHSYTRTVSEEQGIDMTFTNTLMHLCRQVGGRHVPVSSSPPDLPPISSNELPAAVAERHRDSDYGFQHEFELLPDKFPDRTTRASEARENFYKNRYPDIKAYDQTRVKLSLVDNTLGSDYINANYVIGYKERKKFVCAQGPMDNTVNDFWRLVWEQNLEMILMLTNLEEYSKTKCAQYWPDAAAGSRKFGELTVTHAGEKRFADYLVRELKLRLGEGEERVVTQYHYLVWKDFMAPDNPAGILKFIRRINEAYSLNKGPMLVHCSAGVGRTGTLVALDSLLQQLKEEDQVAVFNTVCDLRHQRNFLVQSLKQYIFIYRALLQVTQTGDTEIKLSNLKSHMEAMRSKEKGKEKCPLEEEFEKLVTLVDDRTKSWTVASSEDNKLKNRNPDVLPLDRNRVMLSPVPGRDHSTYINASFIEGYDSADALVITQDPLPHTLPDFWRMISEHSVHTIVMLSDLGDGPRKCIRYWPEIDDESTYDNIKVRYIQSESCPYYTRREFSVINIKNNDTVTTTQFQYNGWPTVEGALPEVTRGMIELVDQTTESHSLALNAAGATPGPMVVHCHCGSDRSSMFTALLILVAQLRTERAVDVFATARKLRTQRAMMLDTYPQYEFVHRALLNYAELRHMTENGNVASPL